MLEGAVSGDASSAEGDVIQVQELVARDGVKVLVLHKGSDRFLLTARRVSWTPDRPS